MKQYTLFLLLSFALTSMAQQTPYEEQIAAAIMAGPESQRAEAMVYGYDANGDMIVLREGTNELICLADKPQKKGFEVDCYHKDLEAFMARSRELRNAGKNNGEIFDIKEEEVKAGTLKMPEQPTFLYVLSGPDGKYNATTGEVENAKFRYVVYVPYATQASSGMPLKPFSPGGPWLMNPGTHRAHIMLGSPRN